MITNTEISKFIRGCVAQHILLPLCKLPTLLVNKPSDTPTSVLLPICTLGLLAGYTYGKWRQDDIRERIVNDLLNKDCGLATDHLEDGHVDAPNRGQVLTAEQQANVNGFAFEIMRQNGLQPENININEKEAEASPITRGIAKLDLKPVEIKQHRRVKEGRTHKYMSCVIAECKAKFGVPARDAANLKAVNRYATSIMQSHGLRPTHIREHIGPIVSMVFLPTESELEGLALLNSSSSNSLKIQYLLESATAGVIRAN